MNIEKSREEKEEDIISEIVNELDLSDARIRKRFLIESAKQGVFQTTEGEQFLKKLEEGEIPVQVPKEKQSLPWWKKHRKKATIVGSVVLLTVGTIAVSWYTASSKKSQAVTAFQGEIQYRMLRHTKDTSNNSSQSMEKEYISNSFVIDNSSVSYLEKEELQTMTYEQLSLALYEIYARHGRRFFDENLQAYFQGKSWYEPLAENVTYSDQMLNQIERSNIVTIKECMDQYELENKETAYDYSSLTIDDMRQSLKKMNFLEENAQKNEDTVIRQMYYELMEAGYLVNGELVDGQMGDL